jgi:hypothetical protein
MMKYFLMFMGYPRSGHTLAAAILNANPNVMCSNQLNLLSNLDNFSLDYIKSYSIRNETWKATTQIVHVPKQEITVIGDKTGHRNTLNIGNNPLLLGKFKQMIGVPIKWIHVVRNPFDNLATWGKLEYEVKLRKNIKTTQHEELNIVINEYRILNNTITKLRRSEDVLTVNHEYLITRMHNTLEEMANFLEISFDPIWRDNVRSTVWKKPRLTRNKVTWTHAQKKAVNQIIERCPWLDGYHFGGCGGCGKK